MRKKERVIWRAGKQPNSFFQLNRAPVFILTHYARPPPIEVDGGMTFHFITGGTRQALDRAREAAGGKEMYGCVEFVASEKATHVVLRRQRNIDPQ